MAKHRHKNSKEAAKSVAAVNAKVNSKDRKGPVGEVKQGCSGSEPAKSKPNTDVICDIATLSLSDKPSKKQLTCASHDKAPPADKTPPRITTLLASYDLVMELVSDYELVTEKGQLEPEKKKFSELTIKRTGKGHCPNSEHPSVTLKASSAADSKYDHDWKTKPPEPVKIPARPIPPADRAASWLIPFWNFCSGTMDLTVAADGCGVGVESPVNKELKALVRIYPNDTIELAFKLPPFKKWEKEKERMHWDDKKMASGSSSSSTFGKQTSSSSYEREKEGDNAATWSSSKGELKDGRYQKKTTSYEDGEISKKTSSTTYSLGGLKSSTTADGETTNSTSLTLKLKRNGEEFNFYETLANTVNLVFTIMRTILGIKDLLDIVPKVGLTYKLEASILEGSLTGTWGNRIPEGPEGSGERYTAVQPYFDLDIELKLFEVSFDLGFGFELKVPPVIEWFDAPDTLEIILKAAVNLTLDAAISYKAKSSSKENHQLKIESKPKAVVYLEFKVTAFGKGLDSEGGVRGGFECEAKFQVSFSHVPEIEAKAGSKPVVVYAQYFVDVVVYDKSGAWEHTLVEEHTFYKGPMLGAKAAPSAAAATASE